MKPLSNAYNELVDLIEVTAHQVSDDLHETFMLFVRRLKEVLDIQAIGLFCPEAEQEQFTLVTHFGFQKYLPLTHDWEMLQKIYTWVLERGRLICLPSDLEPGKNDLFLPLFQFKKEVGILHLISTQEPMNISQHQQVVLNYFGQQMAQSLTYVSMLKQQEEAFQLDAIREMGFMLASVLHELNSPLTSIHGYINLLEQHLKQGDVSLPPSASEYVSVLKTESHRVTQMVRSLLKYVRHQPLVFEAVSLHELVQQVAENLQADVLKAQVNLHIHLSSEPIFIEAESAQIQQVVVNLIQNALQAFDEAQTDERAIYVSTYLQNNRGVIKIRDTAGGISYQNQLQLFKPLFTTKPPDKGSGIGLSLCYKIITAHEGQIKTYNSLNPPGACFEVELPLADTTIIQPEIMPRISDKSNLTQISHQKPHILIVDNEVPVLHYLQLILEKKEYRVTAASSGKNAFVLLEQSRFDLIVSDFYLNDMTGDVFFRQIPHGTPVLFLTGAVLSLDTQNFLDKHGLECVYKPFYAEELIFAVQKRLNRNEIN